jgi:hypothetical protein
VNIGSSALLRIGLIVLAPLLLIASQLYGLDRSEYKAQALRVALRAADRTFQSIDTPPDTLSSREIFTAALACCEAGTNLNRLEKLFATAEQMQERNPTNRFYGNFRWSWGHDGVLDANAVDFCMQTAAMIWLHHRDQLPPGARVRLERLMRLGLEGLRRHRVSEHYTNIALMNAGDLILLGEALAGPEFAREGYARLDRFLLAMAECGTHEYNSPTYYGVDLDDLLLIEAFCKEERGRVQARMLLEYFWTDIALNWFPAASKMAGTRSRDYDYLRGLGGLDQHLLAAGWLPASSQLQPNNLLSTYGRWEPPVGLRSLADAGFPRYIQQVWGAEPWHARTHYVARDVTLGVSGAGYGGRMDLPLTVDLPGPRTRPRLYFIPDGRDDPYGKIKIAESRAHSKTLHLNPFWTAVQDKTDALGLVVYRETDLNPTNPVLKSHFVFPVDVDALWVGGRRVDWPPRSTVALPVKPGEAVVLRQGTAAVGLRVAWARAMDDQPATVECVYDGNEFGAARLTVNHLKTKTKSTTHPGAAFWVRVGSELDGPGFDRWRSEFERERAQVRADAAGIQLDLTRPRMRIRAAAPFQVPAELQPPFPRLLLASAGKDLGRDLLSTVDPVKSFLASSAAVRAVVVPVNGVIWEAEAARLMPPFEIASAVGASGSKYIWMPAQPGEMAHSTLARASYPLRVERAGHYYLWGRVWSPTPQNDSFFVRLERPGQAPVPNTAWPVGVHRDWAWVRFEPEQPLELGAGEMVLQLGVREAGTRMDKLFLTPDPNAKPH